MTQPTVYDETTSAAMVSPRVTALHLLRHGQVDTGGRRRAYGHADLPLSAAGRQCNEAACAFAVRALPPPDGVISSDLGRCLALAEPLAATLGVPLVVTPALREQHMGAWEGEAWQDLQHRYGRAVNDYWGDYHHVAPPGGESFAQLADRVGAWWDSQQDALWGGRWFVATHVGVIRALACRFLHVPTSEALRFAPTHGSHTAFLIAEAGATCVSLGERTDGGGQSDAGEDRSAAPSRSIRSRPPRIALSGSAGTGKSTLGRALAADWDVPYVDEGMRRRLEAGLDLHALSLAEFRRLVLDLRDEQEAGEDDAIRSHGGFVADRSALDFAAFWLVYRFFEEEALTAEVLLRAAERGKGYDAIVVLPWGVLPLVADGVRSGNRWQQRHFQSTVEGLLRREVEPGRVLEMPALDELDARIRWVKERLPWTAPAEGQG